MSESRLGGRRYLALVGLIALLAVAARSLAVSVGLMSDDFMQHAMIAGLYPGEGYVPFDLYAFLRRGETMIAHVEQGTAPWWSVPELHGTVLRPVASVLLWLDHALFPGAVELWHGHSLLWFAAAIVAFGLVVGRLLPRSIALLAVLLFACEAGVVSPLGWLANRCVLVCATFGLLAFWVHLQWRAPAPSSPARLRKHGPWIEGVLMALCIGAGEYGLAILAYLLAWELLLGPGERRGLARMAELGRALLPALIPVVLYLLAHKLLGYGTFGAEVYADPFHTPGGYLKWASTRVPQMIMAGFWSVPGATIHVFRFGLLEPFEDRLVTPQMSADEYHMVHVRVAWVAVALAVIVVALARRGLHERERRTLGALVLGGCLGLLPIAVAPAHSRLLILAQLGFCSLIAALLVAAGRMLSSGPEPRRRLQGVALLPFAGLLAYAHTIGDLRWGQDYLEYIDELQAQNLAAFVEGDLLGPDLEGADVVVLNAPSQTLGLYGPFVLDSKGWPAPRSWRPLTLGGEFAIFATRPAPRVLELTAISGAWMHKAGELFFRREDQPLAAGDVLEYPSLRVEIIASKAGHPTKIRFTFDRALEQFIFVSATPQGLRRWSVPGLGESNLVPLPRLPPVDDPDAVVFPPYPPP
ncbi:MAG: hypothetical protein R6X02_11875 [Enhygromyxa sp.]